MAQEVSRDFQSKSMGRWLVVAAALIFIFTTLPYFIGMEWGDSAWQFSGFVFGVEDGNSYIAKMRQGMLGDWLYRTPYTACPQSGTLTNLSYLVLGKLVGGSEVRLQLILLFHAFRLLGILFCLWAGFRFAEAIGLQKFQALSVSILSMVGGGLGWLVLLGVRFRGYEGLPLEFYSPESFGFLMALGLPHLLFSRGGLFLAVASFVRISTRKPISAGLRAGTWLVVAWIFQPQTPLLGYFVAALWLVVLAIRGLPNCELRQKLLECIGFVLPSVPLVALSSAQFLLDPAGKGWYSQNQISSPPAGDYLLAYGLPLLLVFIGLVLRRGKLVTSEIFLLLWVATLPILVYSPYIMQRRLADGIWFALCALVLLIWKALTGRRVAYIVLISGTVTSLLLWGGSLVAASKPAPPVFVKTERAQLYSFLINLDYDRAVVLANKSVSNELPAWTNLRVVIGHGPESLENSIVDPFVATWLSDPEQADNNLMETFEISYLIKSPEDPPASGYPKTWELIYDRAGYQVFRVK